MALSPQLLQFKSSGVYRLEFDKSQTANIDVSTLRLVVGHSRKGPYNTPVLIENVEAFIQVYGNIDKALEKKGMFFHRSAKAALSRGPILALNLAHFGANDLASAAQVSTNGSYKTDALMERPAGNTWVENDVKVAYVAPAITSTITTTDPTTGNGLQAFQITGEDRTLDITTADYIIDGDGNYVQITTVELVGSDTVIASTNAANGLDPQYIASSSFNIYDEGTAEELYTGAEYLADFTIATYPELGHQTGDYAYASFFDTDKFMIPSDEKVLQVLGEDSNQVLNFVNIKQTPITVFTRKAQDTAGFDVTAREWYGEGNVPAYLNDKDLMSDYMIDVFVFKGEFDAAAMDTDPVYGYYFNDKGLRKELIEQFANLRQVEMIGSYSGSMLPGFKDLEGRNVYIETMINAEARRTGLFCAIAEDLVTDEDTDTPIDLIGHTFDEAAQDQIVLSYDIENRSIALPSYLTYSANGTNAVFTYTDVVGFDPLIKKGNYVRTGVGENSRLALVNQVAVAKPVDGEIEVTIKLSEAAPIVAPGAYVESLEDAAVEYTPFVLKGAQIEAETIFSCLEAIKVGTGLATGLVDKDAIDFRYIVDTFGSFDTQLRDKIQLSQLAKERQNASAILNAPMVKDFKASTDPSFINAFSQSFQTSYIPEGGNLDLNPTALYTLPSIADGANYAFYYGPGLIVRENGKDIMVPPAAYVSNNYIDKYTDALPWSIVAGPRRGVVAGPNVVGAEYSFDKADRDILEPFGYNPIVFQRGVGLTILGNKTAQQSIKSSLSSAHVREVLIYIQDAMADILKDYVFEFNNAQTRLEIKTLADSLMESVRQDGGVYDFKNVMDQSNNTGEVIDNNIGIIDTFVEPVKGLEIVVHRTTILNTGEISTGNFS